MSNLEAGPRPPASSPAGPGGPDRPAQNPIVFLVIYIFHLIFAEIISLFCNSISTQNLYFDAMRISIYIRWIQIVIFLTLFYLIFLFILNFEYRLVFISFIPHVFFIYILLFY